MKWITPNNTFLIEIEMRPISFLTVPISFEGKEYTESAIYYEIDQDGNVIKKYDKAYPFSIEDEMTISNIHLVIENVFYSFYWSQYYGYDPRQSFDKLLENLRMYEADLPFDVEEAIHAFEFKDYPEISEPDTSDLDFPNFY